MNAAVTERTWRKKLAGPLAALAGGCAVLVLFWALRGSRPAMDWWVRWVSGPYKRVLGAVLDLAPFSVAEVLGTLLALWAVWFVLRTIWGAVRRTGFALRRVACMAAVCVWVYAGFCMTWGVHYYTTGFSEKAGLDAQPVSVEQLAATAGWFQQKVNERAGGVPRAGQGVFSMPAGEILERSEGVYDELVRTEYPFLQGPQRRPKPAFYSWGMSKVGFTGYLCPLVGESTLNVDSPAVFLPATIAHEFAHQRGVAPEQEANFLGIFACITCGDAAYEYSGYLYGYLHLSNALYSADPEVWRQVDAGLCSQARADFAQNNAYWKQFEGPVREAAESTYSGFLQSYGQTLGMRSYGACVDLLVARFCPQDL